MNKKAPLPVLFGMGSADDFIVKHYDRSYWKLSHRKTFPGDGERLAHPEVIPPLFHASILPEEIPH